MERKQRAERARWRWCAARAPLFNGKFDLLTASRGAKGTSPPDLLYAEFEASVCPHSGIYQGQELEGIPALLHVGSTSDILRDALN